jgi:nonribosomal peptide synthetase MxcG
LCPLPASGIGRSRRIGGELPAPTVARLKTRAQELNLTWPERLIAGFAAFLAVHGHGRAVVLSMTNMMRLGGTVARTPCSAMNVMPLPVPNAGEQSLAAIAKAVRRHQRYRFEHLEFDLERPATPTACSAPRSTSCPSSRRAGSALAAPTPGPSRPDRWKTWRRPS